MNHTYTSHVCILNMKLEAEDGLLSLTKKLKAGQEKYFQQIPAYKSTHSYTYTNRSTGTLNFMEHSVQARKLIS